MAKFHVMYTTNRQGLDPFIEADVFRVAGKFFEFIVDKEVVRTLKVDIVLQIRRMDEDEAGADEEGDPAATDADLELIASLDNTEQLNELIASMPDVSDILRDLDAGR